MGEISTFIHEIAKQYGAPSHLDLSDHEGSYKAIRELMECEYSVRMHRMRTAAKFASRNGYAQPGMNFLLGASEDERRQDSIDARRARVGNDRLATAERDLAEYEQWSRFKHLLAILTGRYDGRESWAGDPVYGEHIRQAYALRKTYASEQWAKCVAENEEHRKKHAAWRDEMEKAGPPDYWGRRHDPETRLAIWFSRTVDERISLLHCKK